MRTWAEAGPERAPCIADVTLRVHMLLDDIHAAGPRSCSKTTTSGWGQPPSTGL